MMLRDYASDFLILKNAYCLCLSVEEIPPASPAGAPAVAPVGAVSGDAPIIRLPATDPALLTSDDGGSRRLLQGPRAAGGFGAL